ncbi:MAG: lipid-binding SYLF domain-containing protein [Inquilinaceae bacterium]
MRRPHPMRLYALAIALLFGLVGLTLPVSDARAASAQDELIAKAQLTAEALLTDPEYELLQRYAGAAKAVLIVPELLKAGLIVGGEGGVAVMLVRQPDGGWSDPAFYIVAAGSFGLQIGGEVAQAMIAIMTEDGLNAVLDREVTLGVDVSGAILEEGMTIGAKTGLDINADMYTFASAKGLFIGGALEGGLIRARDDWNEAYYEPGATPRGILDNRYGGDRAAALKATLPP